MQPLDAFGGEDVELGREDVGVVEGADVDVDLAGGAVGFVGERRAASGAEAAADVGRGIEDLRAAGGVSEAVGGEADEGGDGRAGVAAAAMAVAVGDPERLAGRFEADGAAETAAGGRLGRVGHERGPFYNLAPKVMVQ